MSDDKPKAVCALVQGLREDGVKGKVLGVSRKDDPEDFGLPGGKVEGDETLVEAVKRELYEETGLTVESLTPFFTADNHGFECTTFSCVVAEPPDAIRTEEDGVVKWVDPDVLKAGTFGDYNTALFDEVDRQVRERDQRRHEYCLAQLRKHWTANDLEWMLAVFDDEKVLDGGVYRLYLHDGRFERIWSFTKPQIEQVLAEKQGDDV